jgi:RimJ/RimL family protein N-acetyltransferase
MPEMSRFCDAEWALETDRLLLTPMVEGDSDALYGLLKDPEIHAFTGGQPPASADDVRAKIRRRESRCSPAGDELWLNWTLRLKDDRTVVGYMQAGVTEGRADMAWVVGVAFQRRGFGSEASRRVLTWLRHQLQLHEVRARIHPDHIVSRRLARSVGLRPTGEHTDDGEEVWRATFIDSQYAMSVAL